MPNIDRTVDIKITAAKGMVTAEIPLAGQASEYWRQLFHMLTAHQLDAEAEEREDRAWVVVRLPANSRDQPPESTLDAVSALINQANGMEQQFQSAAAQTETAIRAWWARQQR